LQDPPICSRSQLHADLAHAPAAPLMQVRFTSSPQPGRVYAR
jgi:hypothetical protein